jgi:hypothetical protein
MDMMVVHAPHAVAAVATDIDVFGFRLEDEGVERQMGLQETAVLLGDNTRELHLERWQAEVEPRRHVAHRHALSFAFENEIGDNLLHPGGPGLRPGGNDDVVISKLELVPVSAYPNNPLWATLDHFRYD